MKSLMSMPARVQRVRPKWSDEQLAEIYAAPHDHRIYGRGHGERVEGMIALGLALPPDERLLVTDLSCGNGIVAQTLCVGPSGPDLGDYAPGYAIQGPIEKTVHMITATQLWVLGETLEHLDNPPIVLHEIFTRSDALLLSTPIEAWDDSNAQHYWAWDRGYIERLLFVAGFSQCDYAEVDSTAYGEPYKYGIWLAK